MGLAIILIILGFAILYCSTKLSIIKKEIRYYELEDIAYRIHGEKYGWSMTQNSAYSSVHNSLMDE